MDDVLDIALGFVQCPGASEAERVAIQIQSLLKFLGKTIYTPEINASRLENVSLQKKLKIGVIPKDATIPKIFNSPKKWGRG